jgi:hypothetical protein
MSDWFRNIPYAYDSIAAAAKVYGWLQLIYCTIVLKV